MTTSLSCLPVEVLEIILQHALDLPSIYKFICASASVNSAFQLSPARILDPVIERSIPEFKHLARMIAIIGTFSAISPHPTFEKLVNKYNKELPEDVLTTAPATSAFATGTPGPRYLVLTAYRIEILQHICFVSLLQNIHEEIWCAPYTDIKEPGFRPIKSKNNIFFRAVAWWSPSWAEKMRITRAYWKLMIYWNIKLLCPDLEETEDYLFSQYRAIIQKISQCIGPCMKPENVWNTHHEIEEMKCVQTATHEFLSCEYHNTGFVPLNSRECRGIRLAEWTFSTIFKETSHWILEEPKPVAEANEGLHNGHLHTSINQMNSGYRACYWSCWFDNWTTRLSNSDGYDPQFPDYLGLCIWDYKRQGYLGLAHMDERFIDPVLGSPKSSESHFFKTSLIANRWDELFRLELFRLLGGQWRRLSKDLRNHMQEWDSLHARKNADRWRRDIDWSM
ncbi:hypothetical protein TMatcc_006498 [Talaromyces marneffei ATCC 18224]|nr:hypothetical protein EYB25_002547 [Talaromyces marneffei]